MFDEHTQVVLKSPLPSLGLESGHVGVVVHNQNPALRVLDVIGKRRRLLSLCSVLAHGPDS
jgi:hypothetical protein